MLIFAFRHTIAETIAQRLDIPADKVYLDSTKSALQKFVSATDFTKYDYILGIGMYGGRDKDALRIETQCSSQFRSNKQDLQQLAIPYWLRPGPGIKLASGMGTSWCNLVSYSILLKSPGINYTFLHTPQTFDAALAAKIIEGQVATLAALVTSA